MAHKPCICGKRPDGSHKSKCSTFINEKNKFLEENKNYIIDLYKETYSVTEVLDLLTEKYDVVKNYSFINRKTIENILKEENVYESFSGKNFNKKRVEKIKNTMNEKYGVDNIGQLDGYGFKELNKIPYEKVDFLHDQMEKYKKKVERLTKKNAKKLNKPNYCQSTGILFADSEFEQVNPNDPRKRTVDHKKSVVVCYLEGISAEQCASEDNIEFVLRYVNSVKGNTCVENFQPIANKIREAFINAGFKSN